MVDKAVGTRQCHGRRHGAIDDNASVLAVAPIIATMEAMPPNNVPVQTVDPIIVIMEAMVPNDATVQAVAPMNATMELMPSVIALGGRLR